MSRGTTPFSPHASSSWRGTPGSESRVRAATPSLLGRSADLGDDGVKTNMRLDAYVNKYTSEDNQSFNELWAAERDKRMKALEYREDARLSHNIAMNANGGKDDGKMAGLITWQSSAPGSSSSSNMVTNALMFKEINERTRPVAIEDAKLMGPPKAIVHKNTRFDGDGLEIIRRQQQQADLMLKGGGQSMYVSTLLETSAKRLRSGAAKYDLDDLAPDAPPSQLQAATVDESVRVGGYGFVATPSPAPGVDASPFMTWGAIDGTPLLLDRGSTPSRDGFKLEAMSDRERIAHREANKRSTVGSKLRPTSGQTTPLLRTPHAATASPRVRVAQTAHAAPHFTAAVAKRDIFALRCNAGQHVATDCNTLLQPIAT